MGMNPDENVNKQIAFTFHLTKRMGLKHVHFLSNKNQFVGNRISWDWVFSVQGHFQLPPSS